MSSRANGSQANELKIDHYRDDVEADPKILRV